MGALKKTFLSLFTVLIILVVVCLVFIKLFLPSHLVRNYVSAGIANASGGIAEVKAISFGSNGLTLTGLNFSETDTFEIKTEKVVISLSPLPFFRKQPVFNKISIINPEVKFEKNFTISAFGKKASVRKYALIPRGIKVENGTVNIGGLEFSNVNIEVDSMSVAGVSPVVMAFSLNGAESRVNAEYDFNKRNLIIENALLNSGKKELAISGSIKNLNDPDKAEFNFKVIGSGELFNKYFLLKLYKKKITVFGSGNINIRISGNLESFQITK